MSLESCFQTSLGIFLSFRTYIGVRSEFFQVPGYLYREKRYIQRLARRFARFFAVLSPTVYTGGKARNFSKSQSLYGGRARHFSKFQGIYRERNIQILYTKTLTSLRSVLWSSKSQSLCRGKLRIFPSPMAFI
mgnify:CR=1 FL=1